MTPRAAAADALLSSVLIGQLAVSLILCSITASVRRAFCPARVAFCPAIGGQGGPLVPREGTRASVTGNFLRGSFLGSLLARSTLSGLYRETDKQRGDRADRDMDRQRGG